MGKSISGACLGGLITLIIEQASAAEAAYYERGEVDGVTIDIGYSPFVAGYLVGLGKLMSNIEEMQTLPPKLGGHFAKKRNNHANETSARVTAAMNEKGFGRVTYEKAVKISAASEAGDTVAKSLMARLDAFEISVHAAYMEFREHQNELAGKLMAKLECAQILSPLVGCRCS